MPQSVRFCPGPASRGANQLAAIFCVKCSELEPNVAMLNPVQDHKCCLSPAPKRADALPSPRAKGDNKTGHVVRFVDF